MAKTVVFTFGRMNPPTIGHEKLVNKVKANAKKHQHILYQQKLNMYIVA